MCGVQPGRRRLGDTGDDTTARGLLPARRVHAHRTASPTGGPTSHVTHNSPKAHVLRESLISRRFWPRPTILRHDPGLAARPPVRYTLRVARSGYFPCPLSSAVDGQAPPEDESSRYLAQDAEDRGLSLGCLTWRVRARLCRLLPSNDFSTFDRQQRPARQPGCCWGANLRF